MTEIINFPPPDDSNWAVYSRGMKQSLMNDNFKESEAEEFLQYFEPIFKRYDFRVDADVEVNIPEEYVPEFHKFSGFITESLHQYTSELIAERFMHELDLFVNRRIESLIKVQAAG
ncbi:MAG: hypothetical protein HOE61_02245 [Candidatus Marinimicrobia bacterium]|jgi:hypothetical protein|nr:hypothetical protein [Candidatus Neomarinimicrobiota bacterium]